LIIFLSLSLIDLIIFTNEFNILRQSLQILDTKYDKSIRCLSIIMDLNELLDDNEELFKGIYKTLINCEEFINFGNQKIIILSCILEDGKEYNLPGCAASNVLISKDTTFEQYYESIFNDLSNYSNLQYGYNNQTIIKFIVKVWDVTNFKNVKIKITKNATTIIPKSQIRSYSSSATNKKWMIGLITPLSLFNKQGGLILNNPKTIFAMDIETIKFNGYQTPIAITSCGPSEAKLFLIDHILLNIDVNQAVNQLWNQYFNYIISEVISLGLDKITIFAHKIPFIGRVISLLGFWYGKTTIWKILIKIRKLFIIFNAILGVIMVYKTIGFSTDNLLAGFVGMGHTYLEIFGNMTKRLFNWFVELFDHKIIPNVPGNNSANNSWWSKSMKQDMSFLNTLKELPSIEPITKLPGSLRNEYTDPVSWFKDVNIKIDATPWYKDWYSLLWWSATVVGILGVAYVGYKFVIDPIFIENIGNPTTRGTPPTNPPIIVEGVPTTSGGNSPIDPTSASKIINFVSGIGSGISTIRTKLNPFNWLMATQSADTDVQFVDFMERQGRLVTQDKRYYPFTEINPYDSWFDRLRVTWLGETSYELTNRLKERAFALREMNVLDQKIPESPAHSIGYLSGFGTPSVGNIGLRSVGLDFTTISGSGLIEANVASTSYSDVFNKLSSLPQTPTITPTVLPQVNLEELANVNPTWTNHAVDSNELTNYIENKGKNVSIPVIKEDLTKVVTKGLEFKEELNYYNIPDKILSLMEKHLVPGL
jgi:hypothetical protein